MKVKNILVENLNKNKLKYLNEKKNKFENLNKNK